MVEERELLRRYRERGDGDAFEELVRRYMDLVFSVAVRQVRDAALAQDVTQMVFSKLAQGAGSLPQQVALAGWLHEDTRLTALQLLRTERRRQAREEKHCDGAGTNQPVEWTEIEPLIDEALGELEPAERDAILLRVFEEQSFESVGTALGTTADAARMRVNRGLEKLRTILARRGIRTTGAALSSLLTVCGVQSAPSVVTAHVLAAAGTAGSGGANFLWSFFGGVFMTKTKVAMITAGLALGLGGSFVWQQKKQQALEQENGRLQSEIRALQASHGEIEERLRIFAEENGKIPGLTREIARLRGEISARPAVAMEAVEASRENEEVAPGSSNEGRAAISVTAEQVAAFFQQPPGEQGSYLGSLRKGGLAGRTEPPEVKEWMETFLTQIRPRLEELESRPAEIADFQSAFITEVAGLEDPEKIGGIREVILSAYQEAVANGLDAAARPLDNVQEWALRRDALDRDATEQVQGILSAEERSAFDRAFIGVMGIDLGIGDGGWHRFVTQNGSVVFPSRQAGLMRP